MTVDWKIIGDVFEELIISDDETSEDILKPSLDDIINGKFDTRATSDGLKAYAERLGGTLQDSDLGHGFVNGKHFEMGEVSNQYRFSFGCMLRSNRRLSCVTCSKS